MENIRDYYNADTPLNVLSTTLMILGMELVKEGYTVEHAGEILTRVGVVTNQVLLGNVRITEQGLIPVASGNVVSLDS